MQNWRRGEKGTSVPSAELRREAKALGISTLLAIASMSFHLKNSFAYMYFTKNVTKIRENVIFFLIMVIIV